MGLKHGDHALRQFLGKLSYTFITSKFGANSCIPVKPAPIKGILVQEFVQETGIIPARSAPILQTGGISTKKLLGDRAPETGIYYAIHVQHRLPHQVVVIKGENFPRCCKCSSSVYFDLALAAPELFPQHTIRVYELPEIDEDKAATS